MIKIIPGEWRDRHPRLIDEMHKLRRNVFHDRLRWQVTVINKWEIDGYDALNPLYVLALDEEERVVGSVRLLPTTGFNMLNDTFPELLPDNMRFCSPLIWEASRFTVRITGDARTDARVVSRTTAELLMSLNEIGRAAALSHLVVVCDQAMYRLLSRCDLAGDQLGEGKLIGGVMSYALVYEYGDELDARIAKLACQTGLVIDPMIMNAMQMRLAS
jgi:N-acyl-L-homoserine lactone synthetase